MMRFLWYSELSFAVIFYSINASQVFVGDGKMIGLDAREKLHFRLGMDAATPNGTKWQQMNNPGRVKQIAISKGSIIGVNSVFAVWVSGRDGLKDR